MGVITSGLFLNLFILAGDPRACKFRERNGFNQSSSRRYAEECLKQRIPELREMLRSAEQILIETNCRISDIENSLKKITRLERQLRGGGK